MRVGLYPGTFDPVTLGHIDIITRATALVDRLVIGVAINRDKGPLFTLEERVAMIEAECAKISAKSGIEIVAWPFENLLIDCANDVGASIGVPHGRGRASGHRLAPREGDRAAGRRRVEVRAARGARGAGRALSLIPQGKGAGLSASPAEILPVAPCGAFAVRRHKPPGGR